MAFAGGYDRGNQPWCDGHSRISSHEIAFTGVGARRPGWPSWTLGSLGTLDSLRSLQTLDSLRPGRTARARRAARSIGPGRAGRSVGTFWPRRPGLASRTRRSCWPDQPSIAAAPPKLVDDGAFVDFDRLAAELVVELRYAALDRVQSSGQLGNGLIDRRVGLGLIARAGKGSCAASAKREHSQAASEHRGGAYSESAQFRRIAELDDGCYIVRALLKLLRTLITLACLAGLVYVGATVKLGSRTFFGHVSKIWESDETQELVEGVRDKSGPMVDKIKRGVKAGLEEAGKDTESSQPAEPETGE